MEKVMERVIEIFESSCQSKEVAKKLYLYMESMARMFPDLTIEKQFEMFCACKKFVPYKESIERLLNLR